jgi:hypothetical protein
MILKNMDNTLYNLFYLFLKGIHLSGIMAILFCGIVMSQYTHYNLSPVTQITMQQTMRTVSFACESCVFAYLGLAIFSFPHQFELSLILWSIAFILLGRALNIFPLAALCNRFRTHQITRKMMVSIISWGPECVWELILVNNRLLIKNVRFINKRQLSTAPVDGTARRCSTILKCKARTVDGKKRKVV